MTKYVCAFRGRRDSYQVPLALAESGLLEQLITDAYAMPWIRHLFKMAPVRFQRKLESRREPGIPDDLVRCLWGTTLLEQIRHRLGIAPMLTYSRLDPEFSRAALERVNRHQCDLFLYSPYAWEAFTASYSRPPRKILFQYHPHSSVERRILERDSKRYPGFGDSFSGTAFGQSPEETLKRERDVWKFADLIICASTFTQDSLLEAGADAAKCRVVPYGVELAKARQETPSRSFHALFVGSGGQRKGLHHLLLAWRRASLPEDSRLTLVCRVVDEETEQLAVSIPGVELLRGVSGDQLTALYAKSSLFVMPSLVEGFGQVYLEALAQGCPVLGTSNTCLPDLGTEEDGIFLVQAGEEDQLICSLERLSRLLPGNREIRTASRAKAATFTWSRFRHQLRLALI